MKRYVHVPWLVCVALVLETGAARMQQPTAEYYDTKETVTLKGTLRGSAALRPPAPMILMMEVPGTGGRNEMWIATGNPMTALRREGWQLIGPMAAVKSGDEITVTAYLPRDTAKAAEALAASIPAVPSPGGGPSGPPGFIAEIESKRARLAYGLEITTADGRKLRFGDAP